ncbi:MAG: hypothetical protein V1649_00220 [Patescibacteria group bacterium]
MNLTKLEIAAILKKAGFIESVVDKFGVIVADDNSESEAEDIEEYMTNNNTSVRLKI